jgi:hypothetical protein
MENKLENILYSKQVVEFVTVANEYCKFVENPGDYTKDRFISTAQKILPYLYIKAAMLPVVENVLEEETEKVVTQAKWTEVQALVSKKIEDADLFFLMKNPQSFVEGEEIELSVSEVFADVFQDLADFTALFRIGNEEVMNDALADCIKGFREYWGKRLLSMLNQLHYYIYEYDKDDDKPKLDDKAGWLLQD